ncbi:MAG: hypothetical protein ACFFG0_12270 [Candidatus Thorarchaeota archaeon]
MTVFIKLTLLINIKTQFKKMLKPKIPFFYDENECPECKALRLGITWIGDPPKCHKHKEKVKLVKYF